MSRFHQNTSKCINTFIMITERIHRSWTIMCFKLTLDLQYVKDNNCDFLFCVTVQSLLHFVCVVASARQSTSLIPQMLFVLCFKLCPQGMIFHTHTQGQIWCIFPLTAF